MRMKPVNWRGSRRDDNPRPASDRAGFSTESVENPVSNIVYCGAEKGFEAVLDWID